MLRPPSACPAGQPVAVVDTGGAMTAGAALRLGLNANPLVSPAVAVVADVVDGAGAGKMELLEDAAPPSPVAVAAVGAVAKSGPAAAAVAVGPNKVLAVVAGENILVAVEEAGNRGAVFCTENRAGAVFAALASTGAEVEVAGVAAAKSGPAPNTAGVNGDGVLFAADVAGNRDPWVAVAGERPAAEVAGKKDSGAVVEKRVGAAVVVAVVVANIGPFGRPGAAADKRDGGGPATVGAEFS